LPLFGKEAAEQLSTPLSFEAPAVGQWWTEARIGSQIDHGTEGAGTFIFCAPDHELEPSLSARCGAHWTGFEGDVEGAVRKSPIANITTSLSESDDLGVSRWIGLLPPTIPGAGDDHPTAGNDSAHRNLSVSSGRLGLRYGSRHEGAIIVVKNPVRKHLSRITKGPRTGTL
jgi:hypothetical protein